MTDTVSFLNISAGKSIEKTLPAWLLDKDERVSAGCTLVDISEGGAGVLIPINQPSTSEIFDLVIMSPQEGEGILTILQAEVRWINMDYSETHIKMGMEFCRINALKRQVINSLIGIIESQEHTGVKCDIVNYRPAVA